jgi:opacity protein-like surface antigen
MIAARCFAVIVALAVAVPALAQSSSRAGRNEFYIAPVFTDGKDYSFSGGTTAKTDTGYGLMLGWARNMNPHVLLGFEIEWNEQDYRAQVQPGPGNVFNISQINGTIESRTIRFRGDYNFSANAFTPFVTGGLGWTWVDSNIPSGLPENVCWYYPWWGQYCGTYVPTHNTTKFSYNAGAGLRYDYGKGVFKAVVNSQWVDFGGDYGSSSVIQYRIDFGFKF